MNESEDRNHNQTSEAPEQFVQQLRALHNRHVIVPKEVDAAILEQARQHLGSITQHRVLRLPPWLAAAAAVILAALLAMLWFQKRGGPAAFAREDLDRNGRVDILDAFALARKVQQGAVSAQFDFNGDGVVNSKDIDAIAAQAVKLAQKQG